MLSTPAPVLIDRGLDWNDVVSGDGPFSDSNGQHSHLPSGIFIEKRQNPLEGSCI